MAHLPQKHRLHLRSLLVFAVLLCCAFPAHAANVARQETPPSAPGNDACTPDSMMDGHEDGVICYQGKAAFFLHAPEGWVNDRPAAAKFNLCAMYVPEGSTFDSAPAVIYPRTIEAPPDGDLEQTADKVAEDTRLMLRQRPGSEQLTVTRAAPYTSGKETAFALRLFDNGPRPNVFETAAYTVHEDTVLIMVLSSFSSAQRDAFMPQLRNALETVTPMDLDMERESAP